MGALGKLLNDATEALACNGAQLGQLMVHKLVKRSEKVQLTFDELTSGLELEEVGYYLEHQLCDLVTRVAQAML